MAHMKLTIKSGQLGKQTNVNILLPDCLKKGKKLPVLYLLHGLSDNETGWMTLTSIGRYATNDREMITVMPNGDKSFYCDIPNFGNYFSYITEELPEHIEAMLPAADNRENRFIAGLSMGGYGALKAALTYPDRYAAAAAFSPVADVRDFGKNFPDIQKSVLDLLPDIDSQDLFMLSEKCEKSAVKPKIYHWCGFGDFMYERNLAFSHHMKNLDFDYTYSETEGAHEWCKWDKQIEKALEFFRL